MHDVIFRNIPHESSSKATAGVKKLGKILSFLAAVKLREGVDEMSEPRFQVQRKIQPLYIIGRGRYTCREI